jgi:transposase
MSRKKLTEAEIAQRLTEGRNYKRLYTELKVRFDEVTGQLKQENQELRELVALQRTQLEKQAIQIAELQTMVFGKKKRPPMGGTPIASDPFLPVSVTRTKDSYRRPLPPASAVTAEVFVPLPEYCHCGGSFNPSTVAVHERYEEDIPLPELTPNYQPHLVTKYCIGRGICLKCGKATTGAGKDLGGAQVTLGPNLRLLVCHLISVVGMSYTQVVHLMLSLYGLHVTDGEIANMLRTQHIAWTPSYNQLKKDIRAAPVRHYDETPWAIQAEKNAGYAWVMAASGSPKTLFHCATSRGTRHARDLHGSVAGVHISDDYGPYRNLPGQQQLCWAHLYRTIRDLRRNANLPEEQLPYVMQWYAGFAGIYQDLRQYLDERYDGSLRATQATELWQRVQGLAKQPAPKAGEPEKLTRLKAQLLRAGKNKLFTCLVQNTPCDNNRAERDLRQLVLKRKRSFGSKTQRGAQALATILSICTTTWRSNPAGYFRALGAVRG